MTDQTNLRAPARRGLLFGAAVGLSSAGVLALANVATPAFAKATKKGSAAQDAGLLNAAIALENEGIAAYQIAAESGLLSPGVLKVGILFQSQHKQHRADLAAAVTRLGGKPSEPKTLAEYAKEIDAASLKNEADVLKLALKLERGAANAYLGLIKPIGDADLDLLIARIGSDEAAHVGYLTAAMGQMLPEKAPMFG